MKDEIPIPWNHSLQFQVSMNFLGIPANRMWNSWDWQTHGVLKYRKSGTIFDWFKFIYAVASLGGSSWHIGLSF
jgi:hypothetical protein